MTSRPRSAQSIKPLQSIAELYGRVAHEYASLFCNPKLTAAEAPYIALLRAIGPSDSSVLLDVGCGPAVYGSIARSLGLAYIGIDLSLPMLRNAPGASPPTSLILGDARSLPLADSSTDLAVCMGVLGHMRSSDFSLAIREVARVLKDRGALLLGDQLGTRWRRLPYPLEPQSSVMIYPRTPSGYAHILQSVGLEVVTRIERPAGEGELPCAKILMWAVVSKA